jgi:hypothetical protein
MLRVFFLGSFPGGVRCVRNPRKTTKEMRDGTEGKEVKTTPELI